MTVSVALKFTAQTKRYMRKFPNEFKKGFYTGLRKAMLIVEKEAKTNVNRGHPEFLEVRTGNLRRSILSDVDWKGGELVGSVYSGVVYSAVHELGFQHIPARPYLRPAIEDNLERIEDLIQDEILKEIKF